MGSVIEMSSGRPEFRVYVEAPSDLNLGNVSRFLQRLDTGTRRVAANAGLPEPRVEIVSLTTGSLDVKLRLEDLKIAKRSLAIGAASLALGVAAYLKDDPAAARSCRALVQGDNAKVILVEGGGVQERIRAQDLDAADEYRLVAAREAGEYEVLSGPQSGFVREFGGEDWVELDSHSGLIIRIHDRRLGVRHPFETNARYTLDGEAHIAREGRESFFDLRRAILLM